VLQCVAVCSIVLQCDVVCCSVVECVNRADGDMQTGLLVYISYCHHLCVAACCSVLQRVAVCRSVS